MIKIFDNYLTAPVEVKCVCVKGLINDHIYQYVVEYFYTHDGHKYLKSCEGSDGSIYGYKTK